VCPAGQADSDNASYQTMHLISNLPQALPAQTTTTTAAAAAATTTMDPWRTRLRSLSERHQDLV